MEKNFLSNFTTQSAMVFQKKLLDLQQKFKFTGEREQLDGFESHKASLLNKLIITISLLIFISSVFVGCFESFERGIYCLSYLPILFFTLFLTYTGRFKFAFTYFVFSNFIAQTIIIFLANPNFGLNYFYLIVPFMVYIFFEDRPVLRSITIFLSVILFLLSQYNNYFYEPLIESSNPALVRTFSFIAYFIISYFLVKFYLVEINTYRKKINTIFNELNTKNNSLENFNRVAAHDLKEPLNSIMGFASLVENRLAKSETKRDLEIEALLHIQDASKRMKQLLDDLMAYSVSESFVKDTSSVDLNEILNDVEKNLYSAIVQSKAKVSFENLPVIKGNKNFLTQLFQNLIANAIKFQPKDEHNQNLNNPLIEIKSVSNENEITVYVKDNGISIPKDKLQIIFEPFKRLNLRSKYAGSGLGLATCKNIVDQLGGKISVESEPGKGTTFILNFPVN